MYQYFLLEIKIIFKLFDLKVWQHSKWYQQDGLKGTESKMDDLILIRHERVAPDLNK